MHTFEFYCVFWIRQQFSLKYAQFEIDRMEDVVDTICHNMRGEDDWVGRTVKKTWPGQGTFTGRVTKVDDDAENVGHRLFQCTYSDGDVEWIDAEELQSILLPLDESEDDQSESETTTTVCICCCLFVFLPIPT